MKEKGLLKPKEDKEEKPEVKEKKTTEITFAILKPDALKKDVGEKITELLEKKGFKVLEKKALNMTKDQAERLYEIHKEKPFYAELVKFITSGPIIVMVLEREDAINYLREYMGATDPAKAEKDTIRGHFGTSITENAIHGSDSKESLERELPIFFDKEKYLKN